MRLFRFLKSVVTDRKSAEDSVRRNDVWAEYQSPERFRFEILGNCVFEGIQSLMHVLDVADLVYGDAPVIARRAAAVDAVETLLRSGLVEFTDDEGRTAGAELQRRARSVLEAGSRVEAAGIGSTRRRPARNLPNRRRMTSGGSGKCRRLSSAGTPRWAS